MDIRKLRYYCAIVEHGQISKAAKTLHIAQPALSQRLKELEESLGSVLIARKANSWQVTEVGQLLYNRAKELLRVYDNLVTELSDSVLPYDGTVIIGSSSICFSYLAHGVVKTLQQYPQFHFRLLSGDISYLENLITSRKIDFAMYHNPTDRSNLNCIELPATTYSLLYAKGVMEHRPTYQIKDLKNIPLIVPRRTIGGGIYQLLLNRLQKELGYNPIIIDGPDVQALYSLLHYGLQAAAIIPTSEIHPYLHLQYQSSVLDEPDVIVRPFLVYHKEKYLSQATRMLIDSIVSQR